MKRMPFLFRRIAESFFIEIVVSLIAVMLIRFRVFPKDYSVSIKLIIISLGIIGVGNWVYLADFLLGIRNIGVYFRVNMTVYAVMSLVVIIMSHFELEPAYTYLFFPYKLLFYAGFDKTLSAIVVSMINFVMCLLMPLIFSGRLRHEI